MPEIIDRPDADIKRYTVCNVAIPGDNKGTSNVEDVAILHANTFIIDCKFIGLMP